MTQNISVINYSIFNAFSEVYALTTTRCGGVSETPYNALNLGENTSDAPMHVAQNLKLFSDFVRSATGARHIVLPTQDHGNNCVVIDAEYLSQPPNKQKDIISHCDALITAVPSVFIGIRTADCVPLCLYNCATKTIAVVHAGWRGIANGIIEKTLKVLNTSKYANSIYAAIGPCIEGDVYEVGADVVAQIEPLFPNESVCEIKEDCYYLDLKKAVNLQLKGCGISSEHVESSPYCTYKHNTQFYSYRKEKGNTGRFLSGMVLK